MSQRGLKSVIFFCTLSLAFCAACENRSGNTGQAVSIPAPIQESPAQETKPPTPTDNQSGAIAPPPAQVEAPVLVSLEIGQIVAFRSRDGYAIGKVKELRSESSLLIAWENGTEDDLVSRSELTPEAETIRDFKRGKNILFGPVSSSGGPANYTATGTVARLFAEPGSNQGFAECVWANSAARKSLLSLEELSIEVSPSEHFNIGTTVLFGPVVNAGGGPSPYSAVGSVRSAFRDSSDIVRLQVEWEGSGAKDSFLMASELSVRIKPTAPWTALQRVRVIARPHTLGKVVRYFENGMIEVKWNNGRVERFPSGDTQIQRI